MNTQDAGESLAQEYADASYHWTTEPRSTWQKIIPRHTTEVLPHKGGQKGCVTYVRLLIEWSNKSNS